jgi:hypothetical protein
MFGDDEWGDRLSHALELLAIFTFDEILEMNDLTEQEVLAVLIANGELTQPERFFFDDYSGTS